MSLNQAPAAVRAELFLRASIAFVWAATGLLVLHPVYREVGTSYLAPMGLGSWLMPVTCAGEVGLAILILSQCSRLWLACSQTVAIAVFTVLLTLLEPMLLVHYLGMLSKNLPLVGLIWTAYFLATEGWTTKTTWLLRLSVALPWFTEGLFPKILFQQSGELAIATGLGFSGYEALLITVVGIAQVISSVAALTLGGRPLIVLLSLQAAALVLLPAMVTFFEPLAWVHPFGPITKNLPIIVGTLVLLNRCRSSSS